MKTLLANVLSSAMLFGFCILAPSSGLPIQEVNEDCPDFCIQDMSGYLCALSPNGDEQYFSSMCALKRYNCRNGRTRYIFQNYGKCTARSSSTQHRNQLPDAQLNSQPPQLRPEKQSNLFPNQFQPSQTNKVQPPGEKSSVERQGASQRRFISGSFVSNTDWSGNDRYDPYYNRYDPYYDRYNSYYDSYYNRYPYGNGNNYYVYNPAGYNQPDFASFPWFGINNNINYPSTVCNVTSRRLVILADSTYCNNQPYLNVRAKCAACIFMPNYMYRYLNDSNMNVNDSLVIIAGTGSYPNNITVIVNDMVFLNALKNKTNVYVSTIPIRPDQYTNPLFSDIRTANMMIRDLSASTIRLGLMDLEDLYNNIVQYGSSQWGLAQLCQWLNDQVLKRSIAREMTDMLIPMTSSSTTAPSVVVPSVSSTASTTASSTLSTTASTTASTTVTTTMKTTTAEISSSTTTTTAAPAGTGPAPTGTGTAPTGTGTAPTGTGTAPTGTGTAPTGTGPAPTGTGPAPTGTGPAPTGTGTAPTGTGTTGTGTGTGTATK